MCKCASVQMCKCANVYMSKKNLTSWREQEGISSVINK